MDCVLLASPNGSKMVSLSLEARRLMLVQLTLTALTCVLVAVFDSGRGALSSAFGGAIAMGNAWLMGRAVARAMVAARERPGTETMVLLIGALQRFGLVAVMFAVGIGVVRLPPVQLILGFAVVHGAFFLSRAMVDTPASGASRDS